MKTIIKDGAIRVTIEPGDTVEGPQGTSVQYIGAKFTIVKTLAKSDLAQLTRVK